MPYLPGDTLTLSAWLKTKKDLASGPKLLLKVRYDDCTKGKVAISPTQPYADYQQLTSDPLTLAGAVSQAKVMITVSQPGIKCLFDDVSVLHQPGEASRVIPLPAD